MDSNKRPETMARITTLELANAFIEEQVAEVRKTVGDKKVLLALSGGVDSSVVAALLVRAIGKQLICVHLCVRTNPKSSLKYSEISSTQSSFTLMRPTDSLIS